MDCKTILESLKAPARQVLLALYALIVNQLFTWIAKNLGFEFTLEQKALILSYGTPIVWWLLSWLDRGLHIMGKQREEVEAVDKSLLTRGLTRF